MAAKIICPGCKQERTPLPHCHNCGTKLVAAMNIEQLLDSIKHDEFPETFHRRLLSAVEKHGQQKNGFNYCPFCPKKLAPE